MRQNLAATEQLPNSRFPNYFLERGVRGFLQNHPEGLSRQARCIPIPRLPEEVLPEDTVLQRNVIEHIADAFFDFRSLLTA